MLWRRFQLAPRRQRVGLVVGVGGLLLLLIGIAALASHMPATDTGVPNTAGASGHATLTASASATTSAAKATTTATPAKPLTLAFTCASGAIKGTAQVCVHTLAHATLTITVRYCDGTYAGGKYLHGSFSPDSNGNFIWRWAVHTRCAGAATATVVAKSAGQSVTRSTSFTIHN